MKFLYLKALLFVAFVSLVSSQITEHPACPQDNNTVFVGLEGIAYRIYCTNDFPSNNINTISASTLEECMNACQSSDNEQGCVAVTYAPRHNKSCSLKSDVTDQKTPFFLIHSAVRLTYLCGDAYYDLVKRECVDQCTIPLHPTTLGDAKVCAYRCPAGQYYNFTSNSCDDTCDYPWSASNLYGLRTCLYPCQKYFVPYNDTCIDNCPIPWKVSSRNNVTTCVKPCGDLPPYSLVTNRCEEGCDAIVSNSTLNGIDVCASPCAYDEYYDLVKKTCLSNCTAPMNASTLAGINVCADPNQITVDPTCPRDNNTVFYSHYYTRSDAFKIYCSIDFPTNYQESANFLISNFGFCIREALNPYYFFSQDTPSSGVAVAFLPGENTCSVKPKIPSKSVSSNSIDTAVKLTQLCGSDSYYHLANQECVDFCEAPFVATVLGNANVCADLE